MRIVVGILAVMMAVIILGSVIFMVYHTVDNMIGYGMEIEKAIGLSWEQYKDFVAGLFGAKSEAGIFLGYDKTNNISYVGCYTYN